MNFVYRGMENLCNISSCNSNILILNLGNRYKKYR